MFLISLATEEFIRRIVVAGQRQAKGENRSTVKHQDLGMSNSFDRCVMTLSLHFIPLASVVRRIDEFMFLEGVSEHIPSLSRRFTFPFVHQTFCRGWLRDLLLNDRAK